MPIKNAKRMQKDTFGSMPAESKHQQSSGNFQWPQNKMKHTLSVLLFVSFHQFTHTHTKWSRAEVDSVLEHCVLSRLLLFRLHSACLDHAFCTAMYPDMDAWVCVEPNNVQIHACWTSSSPPHFGRVVKWNVNKNVVRYYAYIFNGDPHFTVAERMGIETIPLIALMAHSESIGFSIPQANCVKCSYSQFASMIVIL